MEVKRYTTYIICFFLISGCARKPASKPEVEKKEPEPQVFLDFEQEQFNGGVWEENMKDGVSTFKMKRSQLAAHGEKGYSLALDYDFNLKKDSVGGIWLNVREIDFTKYLYFGFWVKGEVDLGFTNVIGITFEDEDGNRVTKMFAGVNSQWKKVEVPLSKLKGVDLSKLREINVVIERRFANLPAGRIYLDDFYLR